MINILLESEKQKWKNNLHITFNIILNPESKIPITTQIELTKVLNKLEDNCFKLESVIEELESENDDLKQEREFYSRYIKYNKGSGYYREI